jgi:hypothetical protein
MIGSTGHSRLACSYYYRRRVYCEVAWSAAILAELIFAVAGLLQFITHPGVKWRQLQRVTDLALTDAFCVSSATLLAGISK